MLNVCNHLPLQPDVKPDVGGSEHINLKVTGSVSQLQSVVNMILQFCDINFFESFEWTKITYLTLKLGWGIEFIIRIQ